MNAIKFWLNSVNDISYDTFFRINYLNLCLTQDINRNFVSECIFHIRTKVAKNHFWLDIFDLIPFYLLRKTYNIISKHGHFQTALRIKRHIISITSYLRKNGTTSGRAVTLKTGRREVPGSNPCRACRPSRSEVFRGFLRNSRKYRLESHRKTPTEGNLPIGLGP